jgi:RNA polymerase sigma-70 factor (ECF subfamily)
MTTWETIVQEHGLMVWQTAYRLLGNRSDADECMQEAFVAAVAVAGRGPVQNWQALLRKLTIARGVDCIRRRKRDPLRTGDEIQLSQAVSRDISPDTAAQNGELAAHLRIALAKLPSRHAEIVSMRYLSEMSYEEIAQELKMSTEHVGVILSRAREKLRVMLKERGADHG